MNSKKIADNLIHWLRQYAASNIDACLADEQRGFPPHVLLDLGNQGFFGLHISQTYGGLELKTSDILRVIEQLGAIDLTLATLVIESIQGAHTLEKYASETMKARYLPLLAAGRILTAGAMTESAAGSNPRAMQSTAIPNQHGGWTLRGNKRWVGMGASAEVISVYVHEFDVHHNWLGMSGFFVLKNSDGLQIGPEALTMGLRGFAKHSLSLNNVAVTSEHRIGKAGCGMEIAQDNMMFARLCLASASIGAMKKCLQLMMRYAFRRTIATGLLIENPVTLMKLSETTAMTDAISYFIELVAKCHDEDITTVPEEAFVIAKILGSEYLNLTTDLLVQTLGARGYEEVNGVSKLFRDARVFRIFEGPTEALNMYIGSKVITKNLLLEQFIIDKLQQKIKFEEIKNTIKKLQAYYAHDKKNLFSKPFAIHYWTHAVLGEIITYSLLLLSLEYGVQKNPSKKLNRALTWARDKYASVIHKAFHETSIEKILLESSQLHEYISHYAETIGSIEQLKNTVEQFVDPLLSQYNAHAITPDPTLTRGEYYEQKNKKICVPHLFHEQAKQSPEAIAVVFYDEKITYRQLQTSANLVTYHLLKSGVKQNDLVAIYMERSIDMIIALIAILQAGAAYLPLDHHYPKKSLHFMYNDSGAKFILTQYSLSNRAPFNTSKTIYIEDMLRNIPKDFDQFECPHIDFDSLGYVMYTSGSSSQPKGVLLPHRALINLITWHLQKTQQKRNILQFTTLNFDMSFLEIFSALCSGGTLTLISEKDRVDLSAFSKIIKKHHIEQLIISVPFLKSLVHTTLEKTHFASLREIIIAGEQLLVTKAIRSFFKELGTCRLFNYYGPSETHVVTAYDFPENPLEWPEYPPIGSPIANTKILILDEEKQIVPSETSGEIYIGGANLAQGYVNQPELTREKFILDPYSDGQNAKLYRTGDFGKYLPDGNIIFLGRKDDQVKIRGFRIELHDVELQILKYPGIQEAVVLAKEDIYLNKHLEAFVVANKKTNESFHEGIYQYLKENLPLHMIPTTINIVESMPLTASGKINRNALGTQGHAPLSQTGKMIEPQTQAEKTIIGIIQDIFKLHIGINSSYASIGGNSLLAMEIVSQLQEQFSVEIPAFSLLSDPTIGDTAKRIEYLLREHPSEGALH